MLFILWNFIYYRIITIAIKFWKQLKSFFRMKLWTRLYILYKATLKNKCSFSSKSLLRISKVFLCLKLMYASFSIRKQSFTILKVRISSLTKIWTSEIFTEPYWRLYKFHLLNKTNFLKLKICYFVCSIRKFEKTAALHFA